MEPLAVVLIILGVLLSVLMVWTVKQRGDEIAREWGMPEWAATPPRFFRLINYSFPISKSGRVRVGIFPISDLPGETLIGVIAETNGKRSTCIGLACARSAHNAYSLLVSFAPKRAWGALNMLSTLGKEGYEGAP